MEVDQIVCDSYLRTVVGFSAAQQIASAMPGVAVRAWCVQWGLVGPVCCLFHKHEKLYVVDPGPFVLLRHGSLPELGQALCCMVTVRSSAWGWTQFPPRHGLM